MSTTVRGVMAVPGVTRFQLIDEDGDDLPGTWEFSWEGRDPFDAVVAAVTEVSGRPWKWSSKRNDAGRLSAPRCRTLAIRVGNVLREEHRARVASVVARVVAEEYESRAHRRVDPRSVLEALANRTPRGEEMEVRPEVVAATMLRTLRVALKAAVECESGLRVGWQVG